MLYLPLILSLLVASGDFLSSADNVCKQLGPDQARQNIGLHLDLNF